MDRMDRLVGIHIRHFGEEATAAYLYWEIRDQSNNALKLLTLEALHIRKLRPAIITRDKFGSEELTLRI